MPVAQNACACTNLEDEVSKQVRLRCQVHRTPVRTPGRRIWRADATTYMQYMCPRIQHPCLCNALTCTMWLRYSASSMPSGFYIWHTMRSAVGHVSDEGCATCMFKGCLYAAVCEEPCCSHADRLDMHCIASDTHTEACTLLTCHFACPGHAEYYRCCSHITHLIDMLLGRDEVTVSTADFPPYACHGACSPEEVPLPPAPA